MNLKHIVGILIVVLGSFFVNAQIDLSNNNFSYKQPKTYKIGGVSIEGSRTVEASRIKEITGLYEGQSITVPGDDVIRALENLWGLELFSDVEIISNKTIGSNIFLTIKLEEKERLSRFGFKGVKKSEADKLREELKLYSGRIVDDHIVNKAKRITQNFFVDKGFYNVEVDIIRKIDTLLPNSIFMTIDVKKGEKVKIGEIIIEGNKVFSDAKLKRKLKGTKEKKWWRFWKTSKYIPSEYRADKGIIKELYLSEAYRDFNIVFDTVYKPTKDLVNIKMTVDEGGQYVIRNINWVGNTLYRSTYLDTILGLEKGDLYSKSELDSRLTFNMNGRDVSSLYQDKGYLFFQAIPVEVAVENDSVDLEIRIYEGKQARINRILISGNTRTSDHVILREVRAMPGDLFSRDDLIRTQRELANLQYFNQESIGINPIPDPVNGTVDMEIVVEEQSTDQVELSGGFGQNMFIGTLGLIFNNFSTKNFFKRKAWTPLPSGDGQRLTIRAQTSGIFWQSYNFSFTEPWLGGRRPNSLTLSAYHSSRSNGVRSKEPGHGHFNVSGANISLGKRLKWPDDYFTVLFQIPNYQYYDIFNFGVTGTLTDGYYNNINLGITLSRNSVDAPIYPRSGSTTTLTLAATPPFGLLDGRNDYSGLSDQELHTWLDYNKVKFTSSWYTTMSKDRKLVLYGNVGFGFLNPWDRSKGSPPLQRFQLGGSGLQGFQFFGEEIISLRGYGNSGTPVSSNGGDPLIAKYTMELRYPVSLNPQATIWGHVFLEGGNTWRSFKEYNPLDVKKSAGVGAKIFLPMFGLIGLDMGYPFDGLNEYSKGGDFKGMGQWQFQFTLGMNIGSL